MDYVYICRPGDNDELKYSIRSVVKNMPKGKVWVFGYKPDWYVGNFVSVLNKTTKFENIRLSLKNVANHPGVSDDFVLMNDDFFIIKSIEDVPTYNGGSLKYKIDRYRKTFGSNRYITTLSKTYQFLLEQGIETPIDYDIHTPMIMNKENLKKIIDSKHFPRSLYGNLFTSQSIEIKDVKVYDNLNTFTLNQDSDVPYISTQDSSFKNLYNIILRDMFKDKSIYEM